MLHFICFLLNTEHFQCKLTGNHWKVAKTFVSPQE